MFIDAGRPRADGHLQDLKELKVKLPVQMHLQLHRLKILTGRTISATVEEALALYYSENGIRLGGGAPPGTGATGGEKEL